MKKPNIYKKKSITKNLDPGHYDICVADYQRINPFVMVATKAQNLNQKASPYAHQKTSVYAYANSQNHSGIVMVFTKHYNPYPLPLHFDRQYFV